MDPRQVKTAADARKIVKERGLTHIKVGVHDIDGILRGKYIHVDKFHSRRSTAVSASATWCWAGIPTTSSTTM